MSEGAGTKLWNRIRQMAGTDTNKNLSDVVRMRTESGYVMKLRTGRHEIYEDEPGFAVGDRYIHTTKRHDEKG